MNMLREKCGIVAVSATDDVAPDIYYSLRALQHRGQEAAGMVVSDQRFLMKKGIGLVGDIFKEEDINRMKGFKGIGHTYYSQNISKPDNAQPHVMNTEIGEIAIAHNGIIINTPSLINELKKEGHHFYKGSEEEAVALILSDHIRKNGDVEKAFKHLAGKLVGSYVFVVMINERVFALRDPYGIKPLCIGKRNNCHIVASESVALDVIGAELIRDVHPGELIELFHDKFESINLGKKKRTAHCFFEWVYFSRADSILDKVSVYEARKRIGWRLAKEHPVEADLVVPIPDSGRGHAYGFSMGSDIKLNEGLMKNRYVQRTFIMPSQHMRDFSIKDKVNPVKAVVKGRRVVIVDDSIVRGTTIRRIVEALRDAGATEVHVRIGSPPLISPCYLGIDMTTRDQFIATDREVEEIRESIGADSLGYLSIGGLVEALQIEKDELCLGCLTGEYPVPIVGERERDQHTLDRF